MLVGRLRPQGFYEDFHNLVCRATQDRFVGDQLELGVLGPGPQGRADRDAMDEEAFGKA